MVTSRSIGQFYPVPSPLHELDPRAKILASAVLVVGLFLVNSVAGFLLFAAAVAPLVAVGRAPPGKLFWLLRPVGVIVVVMGLVQGFFSRGGGGVFVRGLPEN